MSYYESVGNNHTVLKFIKKKLGDLYYYSEKVPHDFTCCLEVYAYEHYDDLSMASTQVKLRRRLSDWSNLALRRLSSHTVCTRYFLSGRICCFLRS